MDVYDSIAARATVLAYENPTAARALSWAATVVPYVGLAVDLPYGTEEIVQAAAEAVDSMEAPDHGMEQRADGGQVTSVEIGGEGVEADIAKQEAQARADQQTKEMSEQEARTQAEQQAKEAFEQQARTQADQQAKEAFEQEARSQADHQAKEAFEQEARTEADRQAKEASEQEAQTLADKQAKEKDDLADKHTQEKADEKATMDKAQAAHAMTHRDDPPEQRDAAQAKFDGVRQEQEAATAARQAEEARALEARQAAEREARQPAPAPPPMDRDR
jgi:hypothetical protein